MAPLTICVWYEEARPLDYAFACRIGPMSTRHTNWHGLRTCFRPGCRNLVRLGGMRHAHHDVLAERPGRKAYAVAVTRTIEMLKEAWLDENGLMHHGGNQMSLHILRPGWACCFGSYPTPSACSRFWADDAEVIAPSSPRRRTAPRHRVRGPGRSLQSHEGTVLDS